jgi:hypothetical protein
MEAGDIAALGIGALALIGTVVIGVRQTSLQRRVTEVEEARREEEVQSRLEADVTARFGRYISDRGTTGHQFVLTNLGPAPAREVQFGWRKPEEGNAPAFMMEEHRSPVTLVPGQDYAVHSYMVTGTSATLEVELSWVDGTGPRTKTLTLSVVGT